MTRRINRSATARRRRPLLALLAIFALILAACADEADEPADVEDVEEPADAEPTEEPDEPEEAEEGEPSDEAAVSAADVCSPDNPRELTMTSSSVGFLYFPYYVADEAGFFEDNGLEIERFDAAGGNVPALVGGDSDIIETAITAVFNLRNEGRDVVALGTYINEYAANVVVQQSLLDKHDVSPDSPFEDKARALEGARIGTTSPGAGADLLPRAILEAVGLDPDTDAEIIYLETGGAMLAAFEQERIDAFVLSSPTATRAVREHGGTILINPTLGDFELVENYAYVGLAARGDWLEDEENRTAAGCFLNAIDRALELINDDPEGSMDIARPYFGDIDDDLYAQAYEEAFRGYRDSVCIDPESLENAVEFDQMFRSVDNPAEDHYDNSICEEFTNG